MCLKKDALLQLAVGRVISVLTVGCVTALSLTAATAASAGDSGSSAFQRLRNPEPPHRSIFALYQDVGGFLWIGTHDGLARYDGYEMRTFRHDPNDPHSLSNSSIRTIIGDSRGRLWVGTENGLNRLDMQKLSVERVPTPGHPEGDGAWFHSVFRDRDGVLWFGTDDGLLARHPSGDSFRRVQYEEGNPEGLAYPAVVGVQQARDGDIWVLTTDMVNRSLNRLGLHGAVEEELVLNGPGARPYGFLIDSLGRFWIHPEAPVSIDAATGVAAVHSVTTSCNESRAAVERDDGSIWMACDDGLYSRPPEAAGSMRHLVVSAPGTWLENFGRTLLEDSSGTLWIGTEGGLYRSDPHAKSFTHTRSNPANPASLSADAVSAIAEAPNGDLWVATYGGGLNRVDRRSGEVRRFCIDARQPDRCVSEVIWHIHASADGTLWVAGDELWSIDPDSEGLSRHSPEGAIDEFITYIVEDGEGVLWLGGVRGRLYRYTPASGELDVVEVDLGLRSPETDNRLDCLLLEGGRLWIGTGHVLAFYDTNDGEFARMKLVAPDGDSLGSLGAWTLHRDRGGALWLGTSIGLLRYSRADSHFDVLTTHDGLPGSAVYSILEDDTGIMWLGTNQGLARFDPTLPDGEQFRSFNVADGIGNVEFNRHAASECADGTMFFGGMDGLTGFNPAAIHDNTSVPPVHITGIEIGSRDGVRVVEPGGLDRLVLNPGDTTVGFRFAALSFTAPGRNRYVYRLEGFDLAWNDAGTRRTTQYTNLPPGSYRFRAKGSNNDGVWNEEGAGLEVVVRPNLWQTWWFRPTLFLIFAGIAWAGFLYRAAKKRELERLRMRIAGDLHDDLSSDLSGIAVLADIVRQTDGLGEDERKDLGNICDASLRMADGLRDIVWYIDPDHDSLQATLRRMKSVASTLLRGLSCDFRAELPERSVSLSVNTRRNVFLIYKEAVHNIARHAEASRVVVEMIVTGSSLRMCITDDGRGFETLEATDGHGMRSMRRRAEEIGGLLEIQSSPGNGTEMCLRVEMAGSRDSGRGGVGPKLVGAMTGRGAEPW